METPGPPIDTPGASKQVDLIPHDIPRILRGTIFVLSTVLVCDLVHLHDDPHINPNHHWCFETILNVQNISIPLANFGDANDMIMSMCAY